MSDKHINALPEERRIFVKSLFRIKLLIPVVFGSLLLSGCSIQQKADATLYYEDFFAMDTYITISVYGENSKEAAGAAEVEITRLDQLLSTGNTESEISRINSTGEGRISEDTAAILQESLALYDMTAGAFDITVYPLMEAWGFYTREYRVPGKAELDEILPLIGSDKIDCHGNTLSFAKTGMGIDLGGIAKGYASSRVTQILKENNIESALVSLGGNIRTIGTKPDGSLWNVAIQDMEDQNSYIGILFVQDQAIITSGGYQRYFEEDGIRYHHILDPKTGKPAQNGLISVSVISENDMLADGLSTSLFVMGTEEAIAFWRNHCNAFDAIFVTEDRKIYVTSGLANVFTSDYEFEVIQP